MTTRRRCHEHSRCMHSVYLKASAKKRRQTSLKPFLTKSKEMSNGEIMAWNRWMATRWEDRSINRVGVILCYRTFQYYLNLRLSVIFLMDILAIGNKTHTQKRTTCVFYDASFRLCGGAPIRPRYLIPLCSVVFFCSHFFFFFLHYNINGKKIHLFLFVFWPRIFNACWHDEANLCVFVVNVRFVEWTQCIFVYETWKEHDFLSASLWQCCCPIAILL